MKGIKKRLIVQVSMILLLIVLLLQGLFLFAVRSYYFSTAMETLVTRATTSAAFVNKFLENDQLKDRARYILETVSLEEYALIEILDLNGQVIVNSFGFSSSKSVSTPDVSAALAGEMGTYIGRAHSQERVLSVSNPLKSMDTTIGVLRFSVSAEPLYAVVSKISLYAAGVGFLVILLGFMLSLMMAKRIVDPIEDVTKIAKQMAGGNFTLRTAKQYDDEVGTLAETFNYMADELGKNEKLKNDFISTVSHELRTPLTAIKGWGETLISGDVEDREETLLGLEVITKETDRLIGLVEDLLDFSKYQSGEIKLVRQKLDLNSLLEELRLQYAFRNTDKHIELYVHIPKQQMILIGDPDRLKQVFINLLDNAFKFTPQQGTIHVTTLRMDKNIIVQVVDTGEGIAFEDLPYITNKFYKGRSKQSGSGLGLAICKEIVQLHEGRFRVESKLGEGTTITVELPAF